MQIDVKTLKNGTRWFVHNNGSTMHECQYCGTWFVPKRRFMQKYCSESCRVMACRDRKSGLYGTMGGNVYTRNKTTNTQLFNELDELRKELSSIKHEQEKAFIKNEIQVDKLSNKISWNLFLSGVMPLVAPSISKAMSNLFSNKSNPETYTDFVKQAGPILDTAPDGLKDKVLNVVKNYFTNEEQKSNPFSGM